MNNPLFSVIVPTFNRPVILQRTLEYLEAQQCNFPFEVVVVDDHPENVLPDLGFGKGNRQNWKLIRNGVNLGRAATRNRGIKEASGQYILFIDDDIWAEPQLLQAHYDRQEEIGGGVVVGAVPIADEVPHDSWNDYYRQWVNSLHDRMNQTKDGLIYHYFFTGNVSLPRKVLDKVGLFDESFKGYGSEDTELGYRLKLAGVIMVHQPKAISRHYNIETLNSFLNKKIQWGKSHYILVKKHPELAQEMSVAGLLAPGNKSYQVLLNPIVISLGKSFCYILDILNLKIYLFKALNMLGSICYGYGLKKAKHDKI